MDLQVIQGDITKLEVDAIVNAANSSLLGGGGVDGAIHRAGGPEILEACRAIRARQGSLPTGQAVATSAGRLPAQYVIHTVGPVYQDGTRGEPELLANAYRNSLKIALENGCRTVAFPNISTGIYGYPKAEAAKIAVGTVREYLSGTEDSLGVTFVCFDPENFSLYQAELVG